MSIQELRKRTQAGFLDCKKALDESNGDIEKAIEILKQKGLAKAIKRAGFEASEGAVVVGGHNNIFGMLSFGTETDFVAKNDDFCNFIQNELNVFLTSDLSDINNLAINEEPFHDRLGSLIAKIGENILLRDAVKMVQESGSKISYYLHNKVNEKFDKIGKIGVLLKTNEISEELAKGLSMHIAAWKPLVMRSEEFTPELEKLIPEDKKAKDCVLFNQSYLLDPSYTVDEFCKKNNINIMQFKIFAI